MTQDVSTNSFDADVLSAQVPVIVDFWSPGCGPCRLQEPILHELTEQSAGEFEVRKVNVWDEPDLASRFHVNAVPTLLIFQQGLVVKSLIGYQSKDKLLQALKELGPLTEKSQGQFTCGVAVN